MELNVKLNSNNTLGAPQTTTSTSTSTTTTPPGWNAGRRFVARWLLWFVVLTLLSGLRIWATIFSASSIVILKEGTIFSGKNIKWMILSAISFLASLGSWTLSRGADAVDESEAYGLKISLWLLAESMRVVWGITLALFLYSAATAKISSNPTAAVAMSTGIPGDNGTKRD
uniref:Uncharacterized protein n=1 Tax=Pseudo-nitzschia australis TaxID=44445 RepID=A0A7S4ENM3_9STRA|eukprot:CAMPEP_0168189702 /NCGR_PEP_ID=MMETSP0139_2-20121125/16506_1 /TAXON_ID=44445 /ORGANISM="Pseudo-nitzschia australis, Strain 10249 10 AB" /LENGTH=170 /DNA_ID=CAMNT_0008112593 /DNA_START=241 /DNA_END=753 /DNA_ORIENTATION=-